MGHKLTSLFGNLFHSKDNESPNMQDAIEVDKHDSIIAKLRVINENIEVSRAILTEEIEHYSAEQRKGLQEYIQKDVAKTGGAYHDNDAVALAVY